MNFCFSAQNITIVAWGFQDLPSSCYVKVEFNVILNLFIILLIKWRMWPIQTGLYLGEGFTEVGVNWSERVDNTLVMVQHVLSFICKVMENN